LIYSLHSAAQNYFLGSSKDGIYEYYILNATVDRKQKVTEVFSRIKPAEGRLADFRQKEIESRQKENESIEGFDKLGYYRRKIQYDCKGRKFRVVEVIYYDLKGKIITSVERDDKTKWEVIPVGTMRELEFKKVCKL
jgi:hypothetical protein